MFKALTVKSSPKKGDAVDISSRMINVVKCQTENSILDYKAWTEQLLSIKQNVESIQKAATADSTPKSADLHKEFLATRTKIGRIHKSIDATQKKINKLQVELDERLTTPLSEGAFNHQSQHLLAETKENIVKIETLFGDNKKLLDEVSEQCQLFLKTLSELEPSVQKICLNDEIEEAAKSYGQKLCLRG